MAKPNLRARKQRSDGKPTVTERNRAIRTLRRHGGVHLIRPVNPLIQDTAAHTIDRCKGVIKWLACIEQPVRGGELDAAESDVLLMVVDALDHASRVVHSIGSLADAELAHG